jgi:radical SAM superfamily enzyme YgiQ (UPF0313 family)
LFAASPANALQEYMPFYFLYLAGYLERHGLKVRIANPHLASDEANAEAILAQIGEVRPRWVGLAAFVTDYDCVLSLAHAIKARFDVPIVVGNAHPSVSPEDFLFEGAPFDLVVRGEGELTLTEVLESYVPGADNRGITGIAYRQGEEIVVTESRELIDLSRVGPPAYHLIDVAWYTRPTTRIIRRLVTSAAVVFTGRGCPFRCGFCAANTVWKANRASREAPVVRKRPVQDVIEELRELQDIYGFDFFYILDDTFGVSKGDIEEFCDAYVRSGLRMLWAAETRVNRISDPEIVRILRDAGCIQLDFGVETGSPCMLEVIGKGITVDQTVRAFDLCRRGGIRTFANILVNLPGETEEDLRLTQELLERIRPTVVSVGVTQPYPGTRFYERYCEPIAREDYGELSRLQPGERFRMAAHDKNLYLLLMEWLFRYRVIAPFDRSLVSAPGRYWRVLLQSKHRWGYLAKLARELVRAPAAWAWRRIRVAMERG